METTTLIGKKVSLKKTSKTVSELWGITGTITKEKFNDLSSNREWYGNSRTSEKSLQDYTSYWITFDKPIISIGHLNGWEGVWIEKNINDFVDFIPYHDCL